MDATSSLSDNQRRFVCRIVFLLLCAAPTVFTTYRLYHRPGPSHWQNLIRANLGIPVQIESVETPVPFTTVLHGVRIPNQWIRSRDQEHDLKINEIRIDVGDFQNIVTIVQPIEVPMQGLSQLMQRCNDHLAELGLDKKSWRFEFAKIVLTDQENETSENAVPPVVLQPVVVNARRQQGGGERTLKCDALAAVDSFGVADPPMIELKLEKLGHAESFVLDTRDGTIPARLLRYWQPELNWLGNGCRFQGRVEFSNVLAGNGKINGDLYGVELDQLAKPYDLGIRGTCRVTEIDFVISENRVRHAGMRILSAQQMLIESSLLTAFQRIGIQTGELQDHGIDYWLPDFNLGVDIRMGKLFLSGRDGSAVISSNADGDPLATVFHADATVHDLASILTGDSTSSSAIAFLNRFLTEDRTARNPPQNPSF